jgi:YgiT-type zinc finger domain-containing protein
MKCRVCAGAMDERMADLPFKIGDTSIVLVKSLPVFQCRQCGEVELENIAMSKVDRLLAAVDRSAGWKSSLRRLIDGLD